MSSSAMSLWRFKCACPSGIFPAAFGRVAYRRYNGVSNGNGAPRSLMARADLSGARRVVVKLGSNVIAGASSTLAIGRIGSIVEQVSEPYATHQLHH